MGINYIWDTNTVIYYFNKHFPPNGERFIDGMLINFRPAISIITEIELLCWRSASKIDLAILKNFISDAKIYELDQQVKLQTIEIRKSSRLKLPDAIIAASAIVHNKILITRNVADFSIVPELEIVDPFTI